MKDSKLSNQDQQASRADDGRRPAGHSEEGVSRREWIGGAAAVALGLPLANSVAASAITPQAQAPAAQAGPKPNPMPQGGRGAIKVLLVTKFHPYDRAPFYEMFDSFGDVITWTHVDQPAGRVFLDPKLAEPYDVLVFYDMDGRERKQNPDGTVETAFLTPSPELKKGLEGLLKSGNKGIVFFHHSIASWVHNWPEYPEVVGGAADWRDPITVRGVQYPYSGYRDSMPQHITVQDKAHPVVQGLGDGYDIVDEVYLCPMFEDSVHCLLRTDFKAIDTNFPMQSAKGWHHPPGSNMVGWVKTAENTPVVYIQHGHGPSAWQNDSFKTLMTNAIKWVNTPEAKDWAKAHRSKIFA